MLHLPLFCFSVICAAEYCGRSADCTCFHNLSDFVAVCCLSRLVQNYACSRFLVSVYLMLALGVILFWFLASLTTSFSCWGYFSSMTLCFWSHWGLDFWNFVFLKNYACPLAVVELTASFVAGGDVDPCILAMLTGGLSFHYLSCVTHSF